MNFEQFLAGGFIVGALAACWQYVKMIFWRITNLLVVRLKIRDQTGSAVAQLCWETMWRSPLGEVSYGGRMNFVRPVGRTQLVGFECVGGDFIVFWKGWRPLIIYWANGGTHDSREPTSFVICFIRWMFDGEALVIEAINRYNAQRHGGETNKVSRFSVYRWCGSRQDIYSRNSQRPDSMPGTGDASKAVALHEELESAYRYLQWTKQDLMPAVQATDPFEVLALPADAMAVVQKVDYWVKSEEWYKSKRIPWRLGLLLYGPPGTGKSTLAVALGCKYDMPINVIDLSSYDNSQFVSAWGNIMAGAPCIALIEDIDATFDGRTNKLGEHGGGLTFDCVLNCISGVKDSSGVLLIVTTNHPDKLDEALGRSGENGISSRPGRLDYAIELGLLDEECRRKIAERILSDCQEHIFLTVQQGEGDTGAQFQNRCEQIALAEYWGVPLAKLNGQETNHENQPVVFDRVAAHLLPGQVCDQA